jgi:hypothetical protein
MDFIIKRHKNNYRRWCVQVLYLGYIDFPNVGHVTKSGLADGYLEGIEHPSAKSDLQIRIRHEM